VMSLTMRRTVPSEIGGVKLSLDCIAMMARRGARAEEAGQSGGECIVEEVDLV
jgi:hypothetical protein